MELNPALRETDEPGKWASAVFAVLVHLALVALLYYGVSWQHHEPEAFEVDLVPAVAPRGGTTPPPPPQAEPPRPQPQPTPKPVIEEPAPKPQVKPDIALPEPKPEKKKPEPKPEPEPKPKPETKPTKPAPDTDLQNMLKAEENQRQRQASQIAMQAQLDAQIRQEQGRVAAAKSQASANSARAEWINRIRVKVRGNIVLPGGLSGNPEGVFVVEQLPTGEVMSVRKKRSTGNPALDDAIERAINRSSPLPLPSKPDLFERELELTLRPLEQN